MVAKTIPKSRQRPAQGRGASRFAPDASPRINTYRHKMPFTHIGNNTLPPTGASRRRERRFPPPHWRQAWFL